MFSLLIRSLSQSLLFPFLTYLCSPRSSYSLSLRHHRLTNSRPSLKPSPIDVLSTDVSYTFSLVFLIQPSSLHTPVIPWSCHILVNNISPLNLYRPTTKFSLPLPIVITVSSVINAFQLFHHRSTSKLCTTICPSNH